MRLLHYLLILLFVSSCQSKVDTSAISNYFYPYENLKSKTVFSFEEVGTGAIDSNVIIPFGESSILSIYYFNGDVVDSSVYSTTPNYVLTETYRYDYDEDGSLIQVTPGIIKKAKWQKSGLLFPNQIQMIDFDVNGIKSRFHLEDEFLRETVFNFDQTEIPALQYKRNTEISISPTLLPFLKKTIPNIGEVILAEKIGVASFSIYIENEKKTWNLISIDEY